MFPSSNVIAVAIYSASRELGNPDILAIKVASGERDCGIGRHYPIIRSRAYASQALREAFPNVPRSWIARAVAAKNPAIWIANFEQDRADGKLKWFDLTVMHRVRAAVNWAISREAKITIPVFLPSIQISRPAVSDRQRAALKMMEEAFRNTASR